MMTMTNCKNIDMTAKELYQKLQKPEYDSCPYSRMKDWGNNMEIVEEVLTSTGEDESLSTTGQKRHTF